MSIPSIRRKKYDYTGIQVKIKKFEELIEMLYVKHERIYHRCHDSAHKKCASQYANMAIEAIIILLAYNMECLKKLKFPSIIRNIINNFI